MHRLAKLLIVLLIALSSPGAIGAADVAVISHQDLPVDNLSFAELRKIYLGARQFWSSRITVTLLLTPPASHEREVALRVVYEMSEAQFRQYWISKVFCAEVASGPKVVQSSAMAASLVAAIPGAIAFVDASQVPKGVKTVRINGRLPGESGYPLH